MTRACPLCGEHGTLLYEQEPDRLFAHEGRWDVAECRDCGLWWIDPEPTPDAVASFYTRYHTHGLPHDRASAFQASMTYFAVRRRVFRRSSVRRLLAWGVRQPRDALAARVVRYLTAGLPLHPDPTQRRLLDVGSGNGWFLRMMADLGWQVHGCEPDPTAVHRAGLAEVDVRPVPLTPDLWPPGTFSAITLRHVIEHLGDPVSTLEACAALLEPGGRLQILCPNTASLGSAAFRQHWRGLEVPRHVRLYNPDNLARLIRSVGGFTVETVTTETLNAWWFGWTSARLQGAPWPGQAAYRLARAEHCRRLLVGAGEEIILEARRIAPS
ncbi:MAG: class I SAM-dependent methyltransferase [Thermaerobacter sp.]|nr:class I SAM-dependent methyltransferase [Thermaerobacter sp.]